MGRKVAATFGPVDSPLAKGSVLPVMSGAIAKGREDALLAEHRELLKSHEPFTRGWEYHLGVIVSLAIRRGEPVKEW